MPKNNDKNEDFEKTLFKAADKLRKNMDAAEYKHIVLGLIFLKYISDSFEELRAKLAEGKGEYAGADPEDSDEYMAENVFFVPPTARWSYLHSRAKLPSIGNDIDYGYPQNQDQKSAKIRWIFNHLNRSFFENHNEPDLVFCNQGFDEISHCYKNGNISLILDSVPLLYHNS